MKNAHSKIMALAMLLLLVAGRVFSQNQLKGNLRDAAGKPLSYATVLLLNANDSTLVRGGLSDNNGNFLFENVHNSTFIVAYSMLGFEQSCSRVLEFSETPAQVDLGTVVLKENTALLNEVAVVARRPFLEQKIDRTVVNVANSITNAGGTALQVLERSPGVQVNTLTKTIALSGKQGVVVMINGKVSRMPADAVVDMLAGMNADNIDRIELIHTPPANFEAEGNAGIINIILKTTGDAGLNGGYSAKAGYGSGRKYGAGAYFNYRKNSINLFGNYDLNHNLNPQVFTNYRRVHDGNDVLETATTSDRAYTPTTTQNARLGADFQLTPKTIVGVLGTFYDNNWYMEAVGNTQYIKNGTVDSLVRMPNTETNHTRSFAGNVNLSHQFAANQTLNVDADFINYDIHNPSGYDVQNLDAEGNLTSENRLSISKITPIRVGVAKADYSIDIGPNTRLETGIKLSSMQFQNEVKVDQRTGQGPWQPIGMYTATSNLDEQVTGAYTSFSTKFGQNTELKAGLRYEHTNTLLDSAAAVVIVDRNYGSWFPSVFIGRKFGENQRLNLSYSRRITRPSLRRLAPFLIFFDPTTLEGGNPALQPTFTDAFSLNYGFKKYQLGVSYSIENAPISFVPKVDMVSNRQFNFYENLDVRKTWSSNLYLPFQPAKWCELGSNFYLNYVTMAYELEGKNFEITNLSYGLNISSLFKLPGKYTIEVTGNYDSPNYWGIAKWRATGTLNVGIEKDFGPAWGKLRFNASDLFRTQSWFGTTDQPDIGLYVRSSYQVAERVFMISWSNTFGNQKLKSTRQRQTAAVEELRRM